MVHGRIGAGVVVDSGDPHRHDVVADLGEIALPYLNLVLFHGFLWLTFLFLYYQYGFDSDL